MSPRQLPPGPEGYVARLPRPRKHLTTSSVGSNQIPTTTIMASPSYCRSRRQLWRVWALQLRRARPILLLGNCLGFRFHQRCRTRLFFKGTSSLTSKMLSFRAISVNVWAGFAQLRHECIFSQRISVLCSFKWLRNDWFECWIEILDSRLEHRFIFADIQLWTFDAEICV